MAALDPIPFGSRRIGRGEPVLIIAEIGINHEGDEAVCARMIEAAACAGADAIKLQTVDADESYAPGTQSHALFSRAALSAEATARMFDLVRGLSMEPFTTCGDMATLDWVDRFDPAAHKISSGLLTHIPLIRQAAAKGRSLLISTGMATVADIDAALAAAKEAPLGLMQCTSLYPAAPHQLNLRVIQSLAHRYGVPVGFSDHSLGVEAPAIATAAGANMIEKHFTLDTSRADFDHHLSLDPAAFGRMVRQVRAAELMLGSPSKGPVGDEAANRLKVHRSLVAKRAMPEGHRLGADDIAVLRMLPGQGGLPPAMLEQVVGRRLRREVRAFEALSGELLESES